MKTFFGGVGGTEGNNGMYLETSKSGDVLFPEYTSSIVFELIHDSHSLVGNSPVFKKFRL